MYEKTIHTNRIFDGRILKLDVVDVEMEHGKHAKREVVRHIGAVAVLGILPDGRFALVRQFRKPVEQEILEVVAGCLQPGEDPAECAARETKEETGHDVTTLESLGAIYPTPGYSDEIIHVFRAELALEATAQTPDDDEKLDVVYLRRNEIEHMIREHKIRDAKTLSTWLLSEMSRP